MHINVLISDDESIIHKLLIKIMSSMNTEDHFEFTCVNSPKNALLEIKKKCFDIAFVDLNYSTEGGEGFPLISEIKSMDPKVELIVLSSLNSFQSVQKAIRAGASDYIEKGFGPAEFRHVLQLAINRCGHKRLIKNNQRKSRIFSEENRLIGSSKEIISLKNKIEKIAAKDISVLIEAETGSGKELVARSLHEKSDRMKSEFIAVNCGAIPISLSDAFFFGNEKGAFTGADSSKEGIFEIVNGGTLFLDEINSLSKEMQAKLLRVLQEREFRKLGSNRIFKTEFRLIAASNESLEDLVKLGTFREDLFFRINPVSLKIPPLRERLDDLHNLIRFFLPDRKISPELFKAFKEYSWPGNIRELKNILTAMDILSEPGSILDISDLPDNFNSSSKGLNSKKISLGDFQKEIRDLQKEFFLNEYKKSNGNVSAMARNLGLDRSHLHQKLTKWGIHGKEKYKI